MTVYSSFYQILSVNVNASSEEIKTAFRKMALRYHPDKNGNSPESEANFILIYNAYSILTDPEKRSEYDSYLKTSNVLNDWRKSSYSGPVNIKAALPVTAGGSAASLETVAGYINFLLWDIEDFLRINNEVDWNREYSGKPLQDYILNMLIFIDKWILASSGFPDYFMTARGGVDAGSPRYFDNIREQLSGGKRYWGAYVNIRDYFYNIRKRMDKFLKYMRTGDLVKAVPGCEVRIIDCIFEVQSLALHYLYFLGLAMKGRADYIPPFRHSKPCFDI